MQWQTPLTRIKVHFDNQVVSGKYLHHLLYAFTIRLKNLDL